MENFRWDQNEESEDEAVMEQFQDQPDAEEFEAQEADEAAEEAVFAEPTEEEQEAEDLDVLNNARLRLEQGKLYEMLLKHDFFEDVESDPRAVKNVQREIKNFVKERLEVLLGIKQDPRLAPKGPSQNQFTDLEISLLKGVLGKLSGGVTQKAEARPEQPAPKPQAPQQLKKISAPKTPDPKPVAAKPKQAVRPQAAQPAQKPAQQRQSLPKPQVKKESEPLYKSPHEMTSDEIAKRNQEISARQAASKAKAPNAVPMPDASAQESLYLTRQANSRFTQTLAPLINHVLQKK